MRDRLIELITNADTYDSYACKLCTDDDSCELCHAKILAEYLLENGVIVPPCKVGDDIYWFDSEKNEIECEKNDIKAVCYYGEGKFKVITMCEDIPEDIGTVWCTLTREDAERALKERVHNDR